MNSKSQIAVEFLMTYGWMIMIALVGIGALAYFGVFNPDKITNQVCITDGPITCLGKPTNEVYSNIIIVKISLINSLGNGIIIDSSDIGVPNNCDVELYDLANFTGTVYTTKTVASEEKFSLLINCSCEGSCDDKFKGDVYISYSKSQSDLKSQTRISIS